MKVTVHIEGERPKASPYFNSRIEMEPYTVVNCEGMEFTDTLTASFLRAVADEIDGRNLTLRAGMEEQG